MDIGVAQTRGLDLDQHLTVTRLGHRHLIDQKGLAKLTDNSCLHRTSLRVYRPSRQTLVPIVSTPSPLDSSAQAMTVSMNWHPTEVGPTQMGPNMRMSAPIVSKARRITRDSRTGSTTQSATLGPALSIATRAMDGTQNIASLPLMERRWRSRAGVLFGDAHSGLTL
jgi:hypothetical protein